MASPRTPDRPILQDTNRRAVFRPTIGRRRRHHRPGGTGVWIVLLLVVAVAAGVWWVKFRQPGEQTTPTVMPSTAPAPPVTGAPPMVGVSPDANLPRASPQPRGPRSIFDDDYDPGATPAPDPTAGAAATATEQRLRRLERTMLDARVALEDAKKSAVARVTATPSMKSRQAQVDRLEARLKVARKSGTPQEKLEASAAWNKARLAIEKEREALLLKDPQVLKAKAAVDRAEAALREMRSTPAR